MKNVCYKCEKREVGCHSTCPDYAEAKARHEAKKHRTMREQENYLMIEDYIFKEKQKTIKRQNRSR